MNHDENNYDLESKFTSDKDTENVKKNDKERSSNFEIDSDPISDTKECKMPKSLARSELNNNTGDFNSDNKSKSFISTTTNKSKKNKKSEVLSVSIKSLSNYGQL